MRAPMKGEERETSAAQRTHSSDYEACTWVCDAQSCVVGLISAEWHCLFTMIVPGTCRDDKVKAMPHQRMSISAASDTERR